MLTDLVFGEGPSGLYMAISSLYLHTVEKGNSGVSPSHKGTNPPSGLHPYAPSKPNYLWKAPLLNTITLGGMA